ncbi:MAG: hypothetical protein ALAOOOJD_00526 [bacterium]|nr:hypothetical protein [bacterium]
MKFDLGSEILQNLKHRRAQVELHTERLLDFYGGLSYFSNHKRATKSYAQKWLKRTEQILARLKKTG